MRSDEEAEHLTAIARARAAGFRFLHLRDGIGIVAIHAERTAPGGAVETITLRARTEAVAARYRADDYEHGNDPLWQHTGTVADVIDELLALPPHGTPAAPSRSQPAPSTLWLPPVRSQRA